MLPLTSHVNSDQNLSVQIALFNSYFLSLKVGSRFDKKRNDLVVQERMIFQALEAGDSEAVASCLKNGVNPDTIFECLTVLKTRWSALHHCCQKGKYDCAKILIEKGRLSPKALFWGILTPPSR